MTNITINNESLHEFVDSVIAFVDAINKSGLLDTCDEGDEIFVLANRIDAAFAALLVDAAEDAR